MRPYLERMAERYFPDEWLVPTLTTALSPEVVAELRALAGPSASLWELAVNKGKATDDQIVEALAARCKLKIADLKPESRVKEVIPEVVARRYRILPLRATDSFLEIATANPFDLDA